MEFLRTPGRVGRDLVAAFALAGGALLAGCGMPGAPLPPSLNLATPVKDLAAVRTGNQVALSWTMPTKTTDKVLLQGVTAARVCRSEGPATVCAAITTLQLEPGATAAYTDALPAALASGAPRPVRYNIEIVNHKGRSAGISNDAEILAGEAPLPVEGLTAEMNPLGVLLRWRPAPAGAQAASIRLVRHLLTATAKPTDKGLLAQEAEPVDQPLMVEANNHGNRALDKSIHYGQTYEYRAQRVERITVNGKLLELASPLSLPLRVEARKVYPPAAPQGLAAAATEGDTGASAAIDLSWQPDADADLAGYIVYRRETTDSAWQRISPQQPVVGPGYHDSSVRPGQSYAYAVSAIDQEGNESARSAEAQETVPGP